jgi:hypothetical protein
MEDWRFDLSQIFGANSFSKKNPNPLQFKHLSLSFTKTYTSHMWQYSLWCKLERSTDFANAKSLLKAQDDLMT